MPEPARDPAVVAVSDCLDERAVVAAAPRRTRIGFAVVGVISMVALAPVMKEVYSSLGTAMHAHVLWVAVAVACVSGGFASSWALQRLTLRVDSWVDVAVPQLAGNAASNVLPLGSVVGSVLQLRMLTQKGVDLTRAVTSLTIAGMLATVAGLVIFPVLLVVPVGDAPSATIRSIAQYGLVALLVCAPIVIVVLRSDHPMRWVARACYTTLKRLPGCRPPADLADRIVAERDNVRAALVQHKVLTVGASLGRALGDYCALYAALFAVGLRPGPAVVLVAFIAANAAGTIPFTPGGVGFVEAGLGGALVVSGVPEEQALAAVVLYRLVSNWLPILVGVGAYLFARHPAPSAATANLAAPPRPSMPSTVAAHPL